MLTRFLFSWKIIHNNQYFRVQKYQEQFEVNLVINLSVIYFKIPFYFTSGYTLIFRLYVAT